MNYQQDSTNYSHHHISHWFLWLLTQIFFLSHMCYSLYVLSHLINFMHSCWIKVFISFELECIPCNGEIMLCLWTKWHTGGSSRSASGWTKRLAPNIVRWCVRQWAVWGLLPLRGLKPSLLQRLSSTLKNRHSTLNTHTETDTSTPLTLLFSFTNRSLAEPFKLQNVQTQWKTVYFL